MKTGKTLTELAAEIERRANNKQDFVAIHSQHGHGRPLNPMAGGLHQEHPQLARRRRPRIRHQRHRPQPDRPTLEIPKVYYDKMRSRRAGLLANNVNEWFEKFPGAAHGPHAGRQRPRLPVRQVLPRHGERGPRRGGAAGADRHEPRDHVLRVTDRRLYIKAVDKKVERELAKTGARFGDGGHTIVRVNSPAITISNSEVGMGALSIQGGVYDQFCSNLASFGERSMRRAHVGAEAEYCRGRPVRDALG
jgi:hypothetical protein